ncbi:MAG: hypothetical protein VKO26_05455 [Cyanobacteriota bacterium]|nr:hypothetical protein [Cyanobacteriota bacterium]
MKIDAYERNGARLGWLPIPRERAVEVWGPLEPGAKSPEGIESASTLSGEPLFPDLLIDLGAIRAE